MASLTAAPGLERSTPRAASSSSSSSSASSSSSSTLSYLKPAPIKRVAEDAISLDTDDEDAADADAEATNKMRKKGMSRRRRPCGSA